jgi:hypothetical protein
MELYLSKKWAISNHLMFAYIILRKANHYRRVGVQASLVLAGKACTPACSIHNMVF